MKKLFIILLSIISLTAIAQTLPADEAERTKEVRQLTKSITLELGKIQGIFPQINMLMKQGEKAQARTMVDEALEQIAKIEADQKRLAQLDENADDETLMIAEVQDAKQYLVKKANLLRNAIGIYILCDAKIFDTDFPTFLKDLQGELSKLGVSFVTDPEQADWTIMIKAVAREHNKMEFGVTTSYFTYVDAQLSIDKMSNHKRVYADAISQKGGHTKNFEYAAREAYKTLTPQVSAIIKEHIQQ